MDSIQIDKTYQTFGILGFGVSKRFPTLTKYSDGGFL